MLSNKVIELAESARYDVCLSSCSSGASGKQGRSRKPENPLHEWIYPASVPGQGKVHILKILQSNRCRNNCSYCKFARNNDGVKRVSLSPDELAASFMEMVHSKLVEGLFLSSGVCRSPAFAMEEMIKTTEILRKKYRFRGYIHLKIIPGCPEPMIDAAAALADRLSINMEAPSDEHLKKIAPDKNIEHEILPATARISELLRAKKNGSTDKQVRTTAQTTQFVVGAAGERDLEIMGSVDHLYRDFFMFRAYFSAYQDRYNPAASRQLQTQEPFTGSPLLREHRLYQCDFLLRAYGFRFPDLVFDREGNIPLETDPKTAWAYLNPQCFPVEINKADFNLLLRVPGIGPVTAERIINMRRREPLRSIEDLKQTGAWSKRAAGWIELNGRTPFIDEGNAPKSSGEKQTFNPAQKWLFEEISPAGWASAGTKTKTDTTAYAYPGQQGKWVNYRLKKSDTPIWCR